MDGTRLNSQRQGPKGKLRFAPAIEFMKDDVDYNVERRIYRDRGVRLVAVSHLLANIWNRIFGVPM